VHISPADLPAAGEAPARCRPDRARDGGAEPGARGAALGHGLEAVVEVSLDRQGNEEQEAFEQRVVADDAVQQCYRVSPGPDFILIVHARDMPDYLALAQRLFTSDANVRNVKAFFR
jgi:DNA-binding Lrp family transcriptional regulator